METRRSIGKHWIASPQKYPDELRERAVRMVLADRLETGERHAAVTRIAKQLGVGPEYLRQWVNQAEVDSGRRPGTSTGDAQRIAELERNREPRRAKEAFRAAMAIGKAGDVEALTAALELTQPRRSASSDDALCIGSGIEAFVKLAKTLRDWRAEIVNYAVSGGASNGFAESLNHPDQEPEAPGPRLPDLGRVQGPDPVGLRGGRRSRHRRDQASTIRAPRPGSQLGSTLVRVEPN